MVGGGINNKLVCQFAADFCNVTVYAGPVEATATGNALAQFIALGEISDMWEARKVIANSEETKVYEPKDTDLWDNAYKK